MVFDRPTISRISDRSSTSNGGVAAREGRHLAPGDSQGVARSVPQPHRCCGAIKSLPSIAPLTSLKNNTRCTRGSPRCSTMETCRRLPLLSARKDFRRWAALQANYLCLPPPLILDPTLPRFLSCGMAQGLPYSTGAGGMTPGTGGGMSPSTGTRARSSVPGDTFASAQSFGSSAASDCAPIPWQILILA